MNAKDLLLQAWSYPAEKLTLREIMKRAKKNTKPWVFRSVKDFCKNGVLVESRLDSLCLYQISNTSSALSLYTYVRGLLLTQSVQTLFAQTNLATRGCLVVFGSYVRGTQTKNSDLDILAIVDSSYIAQAQATLAETSYKSLLRLDVQVFSKQDFLKMLAQKEDNLGKQIVQNHIVLQNPHFFYELIA